MSVISFDIDKISGKRLKDTFCDGFFIGKPVQSVCFVPFLDRYYIGFSHNADVGKGTIIQARDLSFWDDMVEEIRTNLPVGHCNDMEYNPEDRRIYIARGDKEIAVFNPETMTVERTIPVDCYAWAIARFPDGCWYLHDGHGGRKYDPSFHLIQAETDETEKVAAALGVPYDPVKQCYRGYWQGAVMIDNRPWIIYTEWSEKPDVFKSFCLVSFYYGEPVIYRYETEYEYESCCIVDGKLRFVFGNIWIGGAEWDMNEMLYKLAFWNEENVTIKAKSNVGIDCTKHLPEGYVLKAAFVSFKYNESWRALPFCSDEGDVIMRILRVDKKKIYLRSGKNFNTTLQITAICAK